MRNHSYENDFDLHGNETASRTHLHKENFALRLVLKQRHNRIRKWPIGTSKGNLVPAVFSREKALRTKLLKGMKKSSNHTHKT